MVRKDGRSESKEEEGEQDPPLRSMCQHQGPSTKARFHRHVRPEGRENGLAGWRRRLVSKGWPAVGDRSHCFAGTNWPPTLCDSIYNHPAEGDRPTLCCELHSPEAASSATFLALFGYFPASNMAPQRLEAPTTILVPGAWVLDHSLPTKEAVSPAWSRMSAHRRPCAEQKPEDIPGQATNALGPELCNIISTEWCLRPASPRLSIPDTISAPPPSSVTANANGSRGRVLRRRPEIEEFYSSS